MEDKTKIIESEIIPHMVEIRKACLLYGIPCFMSVTAGDFEEIAKRKIVKNADGTKTVTNVTDDMDDDSASIDDSGEEKKKKKKKVTIEKYKTGRTYTKYISEIVSPTVVQERVVDDKITKMLNVMNGFDTVDPNLKFEVDF